MKFFIREHSRENQTATDVDVMSVERADDHPKMRPFVEQREIERQVQEANEAAEKARLEAAADQFENEILSVGEIGRLQMRLAHSQTRLRLSERVLMAARAKYEKALREAKSEIGNALLAAARPAVRELEEALERCKEKNDSVQRIYDQAQQLLGGCTAFPVLMFGSFARHNCGESRYTAWGRHVAAALGKEFQ